MARFRRTDVAGTLAPTYDEGVWRGFREDVSATGPLVAVGVASTAVEPMAAGGGNLIVSAAVLSPPRDAYFVAGGWWTFTGGPVHLARLDVHGVREGSVVLADAPGALALATEDERTVAAVYVEAGGHWFVRMVDDAIVARVRLPDAVGTRGSLLEWLGDRYAVGWGDSLDELVVCPGAP